MVGIADSLRPSLAISVIAPRRLGLEGVNIKGINWKIAEPMPPDVGIEPVFAGVRFEWKAAIIQSVHPEKRGRKGETDRINSAPALAQSDAGMTLTQTDVAIAPPDFPLISSHLTNIVTAVKHSRATIINVCHNLFLPLFTTLLEFPLSISVPFPIAGWLLNPIITSGATAFSLSSTDWFRSLVVCFVLCKTNASPTTAYQQVESLDIQFSIDLLAALKGASVLGPSNRSWLASIPIAFILDRTNSWILLFLLMVLLP